MFDITDESSQRFFIISFYLFDATGCVHVWDICHSSPLLSCEEIDNFRSLYCKRIINRLSIIISFKFPNVGMSGDPVPVPPTSLRQGR